MANKWTYKLEIPGADIYDLNPADVQLKHVYRRNENWDGIVERNLEGSILIFNEFFDASLTAFEDYGNLQLYIFKDAVQWMQITVNEYIDVDYNQKKMTLKGFSYNNNPNKFVNYCTKEYTIAAGSLTIAQILTNITTRGKYLGTVIEDIFTALGVYESFDKTDVWYDSTKLDFGKLTITNICDMLVSGGGLAGGQRKPITLERIFRFIEYTLNVKVSNESDQIQLRDNSELAANILDMSGQLVHMQQINRNDQQILRQYFKFSDNNNYGDADDTDYQNCEIEYDNIDKGEFVMDLQDFTTRWKIAITADELEQGGWHIGYINTGTGALEAEAGYVSGSTQQNGRFSPANLLDNYYRDYIWTNRIHFSVCGNAAVTTPENFRPFLVIPDIPTVLDDPSEFFEGILIEVNELDPSKKRIAIVYEQNTDLNTNITTFKCFEYENTL